MEEGVCSLEVLPRLELWGGHQSRKPGKRRGSRFPGLPGRFSAPRGAAAERWHPCARAPRPPGSCTKLWAPEQAWCTGSCLVISRNPRRNASRANTCLAVIINSPAKEQIRPSWRNCGSRLTVPNFTAAAPNLTPAPSHHSRSSSLARPAGRLGLARHARLPRTL